MRNALLVVLGVLFASSAFALDFVQLKNGRMVQGAILRQDTMAVYMTDWEHRQEKFPPLQVYARNEISAIWFDTPGRAPAAQSYYKPRPRRLEIGGGAIFQTWETSNQDRRYLLQISTFGALSISRVFGVEADLDITYPFGDTDTPAWHDLDLSHQVSMNLVAHLPTRSRLVPYGLVGGGSAENIPTAGVILTKSNEARSMVHVGAGVKYGIGGFGMRLELRHSYYIWEEQRLELDSETFEPVIRHLNLDADATVLRFSIFGYF